MTEIYDQDGQKIGEISLSEKQLAMLEAGQAIIIQYHTPQLLRGVLGETSGVFELRKEDERIISKNIEAVKIFVGLQKRIAAARRT